MMVIFRFGRMTVGMNTIDLRMVIFPFDYMTVVMNTKLFVITPPVMACDVNTELFIGLRHDSPPEIPLHGTQMAMLST